MTDTISTLPAVIRDNLGLAINRMPTVTQYAPALQSCERVDGYTRLIPADACEAIVAEVRAILMTRARDRDATALAANLIGAYPGRDLADPGTYTRAIASVFSEFPVELGEAAVDTITRYLRFTPTRADVFGALSSLRGKLLWASTNVGRHLAEHTRRAEEAERRARIIKRGAA